MWAWNRHGGGDQIKPGATAFKQISLRHTQTNADILSGRLGRTKNAIRDPGLSKLFSKIPWIYWILFDKYMLADHLERQASTHARAGQRDNVYDFMLFSVISLNWFSSAIFSPRNDDLLTAEHLLLTAVMDPPMFGPMEPLRSGRFRDLGGS